MKRSQLVKTYVKTLTDKSLKAYKKQKSYVNRLHKKERQMFFDSINLSIVQPANACSKLTKETLEQGVK